MGAASINEGNANDAVKIVPMCPGLMSKSKFPKTNSAVFNVTRTLGESGSSSLMANGFLYQIIIFFMNDVHEGISDFFTLTTHLISISQIQFKSIQVFKIWHFYVE